MIAKYDRIQFTMLLPAILGVLLMIDLLFIYFQSYRIFDLYATDVVSFIEIIYLLLLLTTQYLGFLIPVAMLAAGIWVFYGMIANHELLIYQMCGVSTARIFRSFIILTVIVTIVHLFFNLFLLHHAINNYSLNFTSLTRIASKQFLSPGQFRKLGSDIIIYVNEQSPDGETLGVFLHEQIEGIKTDSETTVIAQRLTSTEGQFNLENGTQIFQNPNFELLVTFDQMTPDLSSFTIANLNRKEKTPEWSNSALWQSVATKEFLAPSRQLTEIMRRNIQPLLNISMLGIVILLYIIFPYYRARVTPIVSSVLIIIGLIGNFLFDYLLVKSAKNIYMYLLILLLLLAPWFAILIVRKLRQYNIQLSFPPWVDYWVNSLVNSLINFRGQKTR